MCNARGDVMGLVKTRRLAAMQKQQRAKALKPCKLPAKPCKLPAKPCKLPVKPCKLWPKTLQDNGVRLLDNEARLLDKVLAMCRSGRGGQAL